MHDSLQHERNLRLLAQLLDAVPSVSCGPVPGPVLAESEASGAAACSACRLDALDQRAEIRIGIDLPPSSGSQRCRFLQGGAAALCCHNGRLGRGRALRCPALAVGMNRLLAGRGPDENWREHLPSQQVEREVEFQRADQQARTERDPFQNAPVSIRDPCERFVAERPARHVFEFRDVGEVDQRRDAAR